MNPRIGSMGSMTPMPTSFDMSHVPQPTLAMGGWNPLTDPILAMFFQESVLRWVLIPLIKPHPCILRPPCQFLRILFPCLVLMYPQVFHMGRTSFMVRDTLFTEPLHKGETYILTRIVLIILLSLRRLQ
jgi:hypothetical protein